MSDKGKLREKFRALRDENPGHDNFLHILELPEIQSAKVITSFYPMTGEPNLISVNEALRSAGKTVLLPRIVNKQMEFAKFEGSLIQKGKFHEPAGSIFIGEIDVALVPALAIDHQGIRLGHGGGYYDQFLPKTSAFRLGIIHDREFVNKSLPAEWFDEKVEAVATESKVTRL